MYSKNYTLLSEDSDFLEYTGDGSDWSDIATKPGEWMMFVGKTCDALENMEYNKMTALYGESACISQETFEQYIEAYNGTADDIAAAQNLITNGVTEGPWCMCRVSKWYTESNTQTVNRDWFKLKIAAYNSDSDEQQNSFCKLNCTTQCMVHLLNGQTGLYFPEYMPQ